MSATYSTRTRTTSTGREITTDHVEVIGTLTGHGLLAGVVSLHVWTVTTDDGEAVSFVETGHIMGAPIGTRVRAGFTTRGIAETVVTADDGSTSTLMAHTAAGWDEKSPVMAGSRVPFTILD